MKYLSLFSGVEAVSVAWKRLGWECVAVSEIEPFPCEVLAHHYPHVPNLGDVTKVTEQQIKALGHIDIVVFGSPCQDLSVAGKRAGLKGERSGLFSTAMQIIKWSGARFAIWENVPGAFSSNAGADFATVVGEMAGLRDVRVPTNGWGKEGAAVGDDGLLEWGVIDAQYDGVAQRRRRVFAIRDSGDWASRPPILLERKSLRGDTPPSREKAKDVTANVTPRLASGGETTGSILASNGQKAFLGNQEAFSGDYHVIETFREGGFASFVPCDAGGTLRAKGGATGDGGESLAVIAFAEPSRARALDIFSGDDVTPTLMAAMGTGGNNITMVCKSDVIALAGNTIDRQPQNGGNGTGFDESGVCYTLTTIDRHAVAYGCTPTTLDENKVNAITASYGLGGADLETKPLVMQSQDVLRASYVVRRLTPRECERLQGFPDDYTKIAYRGKGAEDCPDGPRYKAMGNSMAVPVMYRIGRMIQEAVDYAGA